LHLDNWLISLGRNVGLYSPIPEQSSSDGKKASTTNDAMQLDDTKHKVYIYSLEDELAESDPQDDRLIFLPDIEKRMTRIPQSILKGSRQTTVAPPTNTEVVLYNVPSSLSVPKEHDNVRKVIIEARARARERQAQEMQNDATTPSPPVNRTTGDSGNTFVAVAEGTIVNGFGTKPSSGVGSPNSGSTPPPRINNNATGGNTFTTPTQNPLASEFTSMPLDTSPRIPVTAGVNNSIFNPLFNQTPFMSEYSVKPSFANGFTTKPVDIHQKIVIVEDPDAMDIE
jgi:hypothetical protein